MTTATDQTNAVIIFDFNRTLYNPETKQLFEGSVALLDRSRKNGYSLALISQAAPSRDELIESLGLASYFQRILLVENKTSSLLENIGLAMSADLQASFIIGDRAIREITLGYRAGWQTIWLQAGKFAHEYPAPDVTPTHIVHSLAEIELLI